MTFDEIPADAQFVTYRGERFVRVGIAEREQVVRRAADFAIHDAKGREIGHRYIIDREVWVIDSKSSAICPIDRLDSLLGETFYVCPQGLRDGSKFGPLPVSSWKRFRTLDQAKAYGEDVLTRARNRADKR